MIPQEANLPVNNRNAAIARASERQHRVIVERELHYLGFIAMNERSTSIEILLPLDTTLENIRSLQQKETLKPDATIDEH